MTTPNYTDLVKKLDDRNSNKYVIFSSLRSCIVSHELPSEDEIIASFAKFVEVIDNKDENSFIRRSAASMITSLCNDDELDLLFKTPRNVIKPLISLLNSDHASTSTIKLLTSLCNRGYGQKSQIYRQYILYETDTVTIIYDIIHKLYQSSKNMGYSQLQSFVNVMTAFLPQTSVDIENEDNWFENYGQYVLNGLCEMTEISNSDPWILSDICDGLSIIYILRSDSNRVAANCAAIIKGLIGNGGYDQVRKTGKKAVMSIVIMFYIQQAAVNQVPSELVFLILKFSGYNN